MHRAAILVCIVLSIAGCSGSDYDRALERLAHDLHGKPIGSSTDQWIEKYSTMAQEWQRTALVFGYAYDYDACSDLIAGLVAKYPDNRYRCTPAN